MALKPLAGRTLFPYGIPTEERSAEKIPRPNDWDDFWYSKQPYENSTGIEVNEDNALTYFALWACRKVISEDIGSIPLFIYRRDGKKKEKAVDHPAYKLLHDAPNDEMTAMQFREALQGHILTHGNAYAQIIWSYGMEPLALWPLDPSRMEVDRAGDRLTYKYRKSGSGEERIFDKEEILHIAGLGYNGLVGFNPIKYNAETIGTGLAEQRMQAETFRDGARLSLVFVHPAPKAPNPDERERFKDKLRKEYGGHGGNRIGVTWEGMKPEKIGMTMEDAQFIESRKMTWLQVCAIHRVPPHKVMHLYQATYSNIEHQGIDYVIDSIRPWSVRWEQAINRQLLMGSEEYYAEHLLDGLMRGDTPTRYAAYAVARQWGWLNVDEIREKENLAPLPNGEGQVYLSPMNMIPADQIGDAPVTEEEKKRAAIVLRHLKAVK
jgi:HK97 family phage portal protein